MSVPVDIQAVAMLAGVGVDAVSHASAALDFTGLADGQTDTESVNVPDGRCFVVTGCRFRAFPVDATVNPGRAVVAERQEGSYGEILYLTVERAGVVEIGLSQIRLFEGETFLVLSGNNILTLTMNEPDDHTVLDAVTHLYVTLDLRGYLAPASALDALLQHQTRRLA